MNPAAGQTVIEKEAHVPEPIGDNLKVRTRIIKTEQGGRMVFDLKGAVFSPRADLPVHLCVELWDTTQSNADPLPVRSKDDPGGSEQTISYTIPNGTMPAGTATLPDWSKVLEIDYHNLLFARRGNRRIVINAAILAEAPDLVEPLANAQTIVELHNPETGYLDEIELEPYIDHLGEMLVWTYNPEAPQPSSNGGMTLKGSLKALIFKGLTRLKSPEKLRNNLISELSRLAPRKRLIGILADVMDVLCQRRGQIIMDELHEVFAMACAFNINQSRFRHLMEVHLPVMYVADPDPGFFLGIDPDMQPQDIKNHLSKEYRKWNGRVTHNDPEVRKQAGAMLEMIAQAHTLV